MNKEDFINTMFERLNGKSESKELKSLQKKCTDLEAEVKRLKEHNSHQFQKLQRSERLFLKVKYLHCDPAAPSSIWIVTTTGAVIISQEVPNA